MVEVKFNPYNLFHITITTNLHYNMHTFTIFALILNTSDSWLFHIIRIFISKYNAKNPETKLQFLTLHFLYYKKFTQQYRYGNHNRSLYFSVLLEKKNSTKITKFHVRWK